MSLIHKRSLLKVFRARLVSVSMLGLVLPIAVFSQTNSGSATLRGTAKIDDKFVVRGVMVVLTPAQGSGSLGTPRPAWVGVDGDYRIQGVSPGTYTLKAAGIPIKDKVLPNVKVAEGNSNVQNITLQRADPPTSLNSKVLNSTGQPMRNAKLAFYSAALPPSDCRECVLGEIRTNDAGEAENLELARGQDYMMAVSVYDEANKREVQVIAPNSISIGTEAEARLELQLTEGPNPVLTAKILRDIQEAPQRKDLRTPAEVANLPSHRTNERVSSIADYAPQTTTAITFRTGSSEISVAAKAALDEIASKALTARGYVLEVSGFADSLGSTAFNRTLSQRRADAVIRYLVERHNIPLRRIVTPYGYGESNPVAENSTREGRAQTRRVEIRLLVGKSLTASEP